MKGYQEKRNNVEATVKFVQIISCEIINFRWELKWLSMFSVHMMYDATQVLEFIKYVFFICFC